MIVCKLNPSQLHETSRQLRADSLVFMHKQDVCFPPLLSFDPGNPLAKACGGIVVVPRAQIAPFRGTDEARLRQIASVGNTEHSRMRSQAVVNLVVQPGGVSELKGELCPTVDMFQERVQ